MEQKKDWVDFKLVKAEVNMQAVLDHYNVGGLKRIGEELRGRCPIHGGDRNKNHFTVNVTKNAFKCFFSHCGAHGNVLDFVVAMERCSIRDAALMLKQWFKIGESQPPAEQSVEEQPVAQVRRGIYQDNNGALYEVVATAASAEDFESLIVYRELFGDYRFWVAPIDAFLSKEQSVQTSFALVQKF
jgi:DNA primase